MASETLNWLQGARLQRIDIPEAGLLALTLYVPGGRTSLLVRFDGRAGAGLSATRPRGEAADGLAQKLRKRLAGSRLRSACWLGVHPGKPAGLRLEFDGRQPGALCVLFGPAHANVLCLDATERVLIAASASRLATTFSVRLGQPWAPLPRLEVPPIADTPEAWHQAAEGLLETRAQSAEEQRRTQLERSLRRRAKQVDRRVQAIRADLARVAQADTLRAEAEWLLCHLDKVSPGAHEACLPPRDADGAPVRIALDPACSALANAESRFTRARRYERGQAIGEARLSQAQQELAALEGLRETLRAPNADLDALEAQLSTPAAARSRSPNTRATATKAGAARLPYRRFRSESEHVVLVGRSARDNDALTLHHARPTDLWLHVRDSPGSHVVVPLARGERQCPDRVRLDAALLAAHFSPGRDEPLVDVIHTARRYVRKKRGSPAGSVQLTQERVLRLRRDETRLRWLLEREDRLR